MHTNAYFRGLYAHAMWIPATDASKIAQHGWSMCALVLQSYILTITTPHKRPSPNTCNLGRRRCPGIPHVSTTVASVQSTTKGAYDAAHSVPWLPRFDRPLFLCRDRQQLLYELTIGAIWIFKFREAIAWYGIHADACTV